MITLPSGLPAARILDAEGLTRTGRPGSGRALRIALVNLMPRKEATELALARLLAGGGCDVELTLVVPGSYAPRTANPAHLARFYRRWPQVRDEAFDGLVVTGAPVETLPFTDVVYWREMREIVTWARANAGSTLYICWAAQAALNINRGIPKTLLPAKAFGVFEQHVLAPASPLTMGLGPRFPAPVSRHAGVCETALAACGLAPLARSAEGGACLVDDPDNRAVLMFDHLEYDADTLALEYERDLAAGKPAHPPLMARPGWSWRPYAALFFRNWLDRVEACRALRPAAAA
ncbi:homoserine O-succinyltransferase [Salinarimonas soli]|uniref:Homoserine O-acetyltransferase n=1 Tax=Salinarimonas soli TaxID=1638099 RepID=A0A5B2VEM7_9HYPH|nr:homoserine O-succinyltransferase [Salinarimonas soli]KAA2237561.1 homoserine O-succinyltransferase [Salinarimonas soli]